MDDDDAGPVSDEQREAGTESILDSGDGSKETLPSDAATSKDASSASEAGATISDATVEGSANGDHDAGPNGVFPEAGDTGGNEGGIAAETGTPLCTTASCDDGRICNGIEICNPITGCQPGTPNNGSDDDGDGYTDAQGDCNDCVADINPSAAELGGNGVDEDCDGQAPNMVPSCDSALTLASGDPLDGARAVGLCKVGVGIRWGATSASWVQPDGTGIPSAVGHGLLQRFGVTTPREGSTMLALSTGAARAPGDPGYVAPRPGLEKGYQSNYLPDLPKTSRHCNNVMFAQPYDGSALQLTIKVPSNVDRLAFDFAYFTADWMDGICGNFDDQFAVTMKKLGSSDPAINLAPDELGDVMSVNSHFVAACTCPTAPSCTYNIYDLNCSLGAGVLSGTGYETGPVAGHSHGGTGWLTASVPVTAGSTIVVTALIYDSLDGTYDSLALLDAFRFYRAPAGDGQTLPMVKRAQ